MSTQCPVCLSEGTQRIPQKVSGRLDVGLHECQDCELHFLDIWDDEARVRSFYAENEVVTGSNICFVKWSHP